MKVLIVNCGSSSLKYQLLEMADNQLLAKGIIERIGISGSAICHEKTGKPEKLLLETPIIDHKTAFKYMIDALLDSEHGVISTTADIGAVGHRVVHAGEKYSSSVLINDEVLNVLRECSDLAPLHNPSNICGIEVCRELIPNTPMVAVFDTAFHQTIPAEAYMYALPYAYYEKYGIRKYGFHGTSHKYVAERAADILGVNLNDLKIITCHLGNGASVTAIKRGKSIDTSMGFTPLEGLVMGTRSGDMDPSILIYICEKENIELADLMEILNKQSGVYGISGVSSDFRDLAKAVEAGNERAELAIKVFAHKVRFYIGAYIAIMNGVDAIVFTAGLGENSSNMRAIICHELGNLGIKLDLVKNRVQGKELVISKDDSRVSILMIPTNEELMIAKDTYKLVRHLDY